MSKAVSYSRMSGYKKCPASYEWQYVLGHKEEFNPGPAALRGLEIHGSIEDYYNGKRDALHHEIPDKMAEHILKHHGKEDWIFYPEYEFALTKDWTPTTFDAEDAFVRGYIDNLLTRVDVDQNVVEVIVDEYKTGQIYPEHAEQKALYALVAMCLYPDIPQVEVVGVYIDKKKLHPTKYGRAMLFSMKHQWKRDIEKMSIPIYPARPGMHCRWCPKSSKHKEGPCKVG